MPTGYTSPVIDGATFEQYLQGCARAFIIQLRDDPFDKPLPRSLPPYTWHADELATATEERARLSAMSADELAAAAEAAHQTDLKYWEDRQTNKQEQFAKYRAMLAKVQMWKVPTPEHAPLKEFMISQLTDSIKHDCDMESKYDQRPEPKTAEQYKADRLSRIEYDLEYHGKRNVETVENHAKLNAWLEALHQSMEKKS